jgi:hypothetical protein
LPAGVEPKFNVSNESLVFFTGYVLMMQGYTDKKENKLFLIYEEIQNGAVAKSYMTNGLLIDGEIFSHFLIYLEALPHI